jgi:ABC-type antimicrobial peptide transport system permease subunit
MDSLDVVIRSGGSTTGLAGAVRDRVHAFDPELPVTRVLAMKDLVARSLGPQEFNTLLMSTFSGLALLLAAVGIYGVLSYLVGQRIQEIGIRMALGARGGDVMRMVMMESLRVLGVGLAIGVAGALAFHRLLSTVLFEVSSTDPSSFFTVGLVLTVLVLAASFVPARRATKVEPLVALRYE